MSEALKAIESASRRELQALAKELQLCRGNSKSDVIVSHAMQFLDDHPKDGEKQVLGALNGDSGSPKATAEKASPKFKKQSPKGKKQETTPKKQPEDEPIATVKSVGTKTKEKTPTKKDTSNGADKEKEKVTPKDKKKTKQAASPASSAKTTVTTAPPATSTKTSVKVSSAKSPKTSVKASPAKSTEVKVKAPPAKSSEALVKASPSTKKSPTSKSKPLEKVVVKTQVVNKKEHSSATKKTTPVSKKAEMKARKAVEALVKSTPDLTFLGDTRVRCSTTGHEMKADLELIKKYITGKRYQKARNLKLSFAKYAPMFVDHPDESKSDMLWCNVTESAIARDVKRVKEHIAAPKYQKELPIWKEQEAAKKKAEEEEAQRRAARIEAAKKRRLAAANGDGNDKNERPAKRAKKTVDSM